MTHEDRLQAYRNASNHLSDAIMGWEALTVLIVNALHFESSIVGAYADGISILMWEKVEALKEVEKQFPDLAPADEDESTLNKVLRATKDTRTSPLAEEIETLRTVQAFADREPIDASEIAAAFKVDPEVVERIVSELSKAKTPDARPGREGRRGRAAAG